MILRRLAEAVTEQNWFTVVLEVLIVVVGIFIGLQVDYWNTERIERHIDEVNAGLEPLTSFVLPGGTQASAWLHLARTVCRRAERLVTELATLDEEQGRVNPEVVRYLNRLSDLFFVIGRAANDGGQGDVLWKPGAGRE